MRPAPTVRAAVIGLVLFAPARALATYSIVGVNTATREVGGAGTSCVGSNISVYQIYGSAPDRGVVAAQAALNSRGRDAAVQQLTQGTAPAQIIQNITSSSFDPSSASRQYGIVDVQGRAAGHTGSTNGNFADDRQGMVGTFAYSTQGNILTGGAVLTQAAAAFEAGGCDLADRLMRALEAGAQNNQGDSRCTPRGIPSDGAFVQVDRPNEQRGSYLSLRVDATGSQNPITRLRTQFDTWRQTHPCGDAGTGGTGGTGGSAGTAGTAGTNGVSGRGGSGGTAGAAGTVGRGGTAGASGTAGTNGAAGMGGTAGTAGGAPGGTGSGATSGGSGAIGTNGVSGGAGAASGTRGAAPGGESDSGCGCRVSSRGTSPLLSLIAALSLLLVRRGARRDRPHTA
jgi:uncharacterized Ntn-hydrolase superfamily protein